MYIFLGFFPTKTFPRLCFLLLLPRDDLRVNKLLISKNLVYVQEHPPGSTCALRHPYTLCLFLAAGGGDTAAWAFSMLSGSISLAASAVYTML